MDGTAKTITLDLSKTEELANFASEVLTRLAFFGTAPALVKRERAKSAHKNLEIMSKTLHKQLSERMNRYQEEYDNIRDTLPGCPVPDNNPEQVGH